MHQRKQRMHDWADAFIVLPGGFGTLDELFEALTLIQTGKVKHFPVILFGRAYWQGLIDWLRDTVSREGKVSAPDLELFHLTDDPREAADIVIRAREERPAIPVIGGLDPQYPDQ
jgi:uncharacterized protein (TIGR00730 family)